MSGHAYADPDPRIRLVKPVTWSWRDDGAGTAPYIERWDVKGERWEKKVAWVGALHEGLDAGDSLQGIVSRAHARTPEISRRAAEELVRSHLMRLYRVGHVEIPVEPPPAMFAGRYRVIRELGRGGVGRAFLAADVGADDALVVVKHAWDFLSPVSYTNTLVRDEGRVLQKLDHPGIVRYLDSFETDGLYHLVRDYLDGPEIFERYFRTGVPGRERLRLLLAELADEIQHVHDRGFLLFDVRPTNFMLIGKEERALLADVGLARAWNGGEMTLDGRLGSKGFIAPEVMQRHAVSAATDVFSLGRLAMFLATGWIPLQHWTADDVAKHMRYHAASEEDVALVRTLTAEDPHVRPRSMAEVAGLLRASL